jgi:hypothetical protein
VAHRFYRRTANSLSAEWRTRVGGLAPFAALHEAALGPSRSISHGDLTSALGAKRKRAAWQSPPRQHAMTRSHCRRRSDRPILMLR